MILLTHILVATASIGYTAYVFISPSKSRLHIAYALVAATLVTGFGLVLSKPAHMTQTCVEGLVYLAFASLGLVAARHKLAIAQI